MFFSEGFGPVLLNIFQYYFGSHIQKELRVGVWLASSFFVLLWFPLGAAEACRNSATS